MNYDELKIAFPNFSHFYIVNGITLDEAMDRCARLTGDDAHVLNFNNQLLFAAQHEISNDIPWLTWVEEPTE
jgi:hypothetical protein